MNDSFFIFYLAKKIQLFFISSVIILLLTNCTLGTYQQGTFYHLSATALSTNNAHLKTCIFDPHYSIVHFPMYHFPSNGHYTTKEYEKVTQSQFQLMHTIIHYNRYPYRHLFVFDENIVTDYYDQNYFALLSSGGANSDTYQRSDGRIFQIRERQNTARQLFSSGFPKYYEHLSKLQKDFLFNTGASLTLYFLGEIPKIYKVISPESFDLVKRNVQNLYGQVELEGNDYWVFDFREEELRKEVVNFLQKNNSSKNIILIAYGATHNIADEFANWPFQSGHNFCLNWLNQAISNPSNLP